MDINPQDINKIALLADLPIADKNTLTKQLHVKIFKRNEVVVHKGQPPSELYFLFSGRLKVVDYTASGREVGFIFIEAGSHFGELALIDSKPRSASIVATESSTVGCLSRNDARQLMFSAPSVSEKLLKQLASIIRHNNEHIVMLGSTSATARINIFLLKYAKMRHGSLTIEKLPTQSEFATMANTTRETVSRTLSQLMDRGLIEKQGKRLIILKPEKLQEMTLE